ncbi:ATP-binding protein [Herbiconiux gentiana]|uniref:ATP-binding protein n=1 Tax=Herbiconiux gentiana TaxID=2970912 RepID=UPI0035C6B5D7
MGRGALRVLLGAAPGVGKTVAMLEEGRRLADEGRDVVIAVVESHGRAATEAAAEGFEIVPRRGVEHRGLGLGELDLEAVLARAPEVALVDELAHTNAPGLAHEKRWRDVEALRDAGIDVISTVNIQHVESLNDVVQQITGVPQHETVPDAVLRDADQVELIDLAPDALRERLAAGRVYPAARVDAALSNFFRLGNLTALRELALLWLADEVDSALQRYREAKGIGAAWEARERVVVALTGGPEGETLLRRGARIAARSAGGRLLAVHVSAPDGLRERNPEALARQRSLVESLGGSFHQLVDDDVPGALVGFARASNATQLVLGASRRSRLAALVTGPGIGATVIRESGDIDVHIVTHAAAGGRRRLPGTRGSLTVRRRVAGFAFAVVAGPLLTWLLSAVRSDESITTEVLAYQLLVVIAALIGGLGPALFSAVLSGLTLDYFFVAPLYSVTIADPLHALALGLYVVIAVLVSLVVDRAARRARAARRSAAESELLATVAGSVLRGQDALQALVTVTREAFGLSAVRLVRSGQVLYADESPGATDARPAPRDTAAEEAARTGAAAEAVLRVPVSAADSAPGGPPADPAELELHGRPLSAADRRLLAVIVAQLAAALEHQGLAETASGLAPLAAADRVRSALLAAVGHDLRRPLASATAAVTGLRSELPAADRDELLTTAEESLASLTRLLTDLLDVSRVEAGVLGVSLAPVELADVLPGVLDELGAGPEQLELELPPALPAFDADPVLLERVLVNLLSNALRFSPAGERVVVSASAFAGRVELRVVDRGPGIPADRRSEVFVPFQRLGDLDNATGLGLGLALSKGFAEGMGGSLEAEDTPGGGLTMVVSLPVARTDDAQEAPE